MSFSANQRPLLADRPSSDTPVVLCFIFFVFLLRTVWLATGAIGISGDEAYYWDWSRQLSAGYFSKPPGIAWLNYIVTSLFGVSAFGIKATASFIAALGLVPFYFGLREANPKLAKWTTITLAIIPGQLLLGSFLTTDAPLVLTWNTTFYVTMRLIHRSEKQPLWLYFLLLGALALGHVFKQMTFAAIPLIILSLLIANRHQLLSPALWLAMLFSLVSLIPTFLWNEQNGWITAVHTAHHFESQAITLIGTLDRLVINLYAILALLLSPVIFVLIARAAWRALRHFTSLSKAQKVLFLWGVLPLLCISLLTIRQRVNPNWPAVYFSPCLALAASFFVQSDHPSKIWKIAMRVSLAFCVIAGLLFSNYEFLSKHVNALKATRRGWHGYPELVAKIDQLRHSDASLSDLTLCGVGHRHITSQLAFHLSDHPRCYHFPPRSEHTNSQYDLWDGPALGSDLLLVAEINAADEALPANVRDAFDKLEAIALFPFHPSRNFPQFRIYRATQLKYWPVYKK